MGSIEVFIRIKTCRVSLGVRAWSTLPVPRVLGGQGPVPGRPDLLAHRERFVDVVSAAIGVPTR